MPSTKNIIEANIKNNLTVALNHFDFRFIGISGNAYLCPGLEGYEKLPSIFKFKVIDGTSDSINSNGPSLQSAAADYAEKYNKMLLEKLGYIVPNFH